MIEPCSWEKLLLRVQGFFMIFWEVIDTFYKKYLYKGHVTMKLKINGMKQF